MWPLANQENHQDISDDERGAAPEDFDTIDLLVHRREDEDIQPEGWMDQTVSLEGDTVAVRVPTRSYRATVTTIEGESSALIPPLTIAP